MWVLGVLVAHPDYKRPSVETNVFFFESEKEALYKLKELKVEFIVDYDNSEDSRIITLTINSSDELIEELFEMVSDIDNYYSESYMDNKPFDWHISEVKAGSKFTFV